MSCYASIENVDFYVKDLYQAFHEYSDIEKPVDVYDDGFSDLLKYSWAAIAPGNQVNKFFYYRQGINADRDFRTKWNQAYWHIRELNEFLVDMHNGLASGLDQNKLAIPCGRSSCYPCFRLPGIGKTLWWYRAENF